MSPEEALDQLRELIIDARGAIIGRPGIKLWVTYDDIDALNVAIEVLEEKVDG